MSIPEETNPVLTGLYTDCQHILSQKDYNAMTVDNALLRKIEGAVGQGVLDPNIGSQMLGALNRFKDRQISTLLAEDKQEIATVFKRALGVSRADSAYGSAEGMTREALLQKAGFDPGSDLDVLQGEQRAFQENVKSALRSNSLRAPDESRVSIKREGPVYVLDLKPLELFMTVDVEDDLGGEDTMAPRIFDKDQLKHQRSQYISISLPNTDTIIVTTPDKAQELMAHTRDFISKISSDKLLHTFQERLVKTLLLMTTQHIGNGVIIPLKSLENIRFDLELGDNKFETYIDTMTCSFEPVIGMFGREKKDQFQIKMEARLITERKPITPRDLTIEEKKERLSARAALGMSPPVEASATCRFICSVTSQGAVIITGMNSKYTLEVKE